MDALFDECLKFTLQAEGGFVDNPADPGGATNMGITLATLRHWSDDPGLGVAQVQNMSEHTVAAIYRTLYWNPLRGDALPPGVDLSVFDFGVNTGIWRSARVLQQALGFPDNQVDGSIGPITIWSIAKADARTLIDALADRQAAFYRSLADFATFGRGWLDRTARRRTASLAMFGSRQTDTA